MNHYNWTYVAGEGKTYPVGLMHGAKTGHVLIYVSGKIVVIDFKVFESKTYTFFINEELCTIRLERRKDEMYYHFEIDRKTDTPLNVYRRKRDRKYMWQMWVAIGVFAGIVALFVVLAKSFKPDPFEAMEANSRRVQTVGKVLIKNSAPKPEISYSFVANNNAWSAKPDLQPQPLILLSNGMPLESGDEFAVFYLPSDPAVSQVDFEKPTEAQLEKYRRRALEKYLQAHPDEAKAIAACLVNAAFELKGVSGLADFYFQDASPKVNPDHNHQTFQRLTEDLPFQKKVEKECR